jgi:hypothetical protein
MTHFPAAAILLAGSTLSAWLRFDRGVPLVSWIVMLVCIAGVMVTWLVEARHAPPIVFPSEVQELGARDQLTPDEERRFGDRLPACPAIAIDVRAQWTNSIALSRTSIGTA